MPNGRRVEPHTPFQERLAKWVEGVRERASHIPPGPERDALLTKARQADTALHLNEWANSNGE
jgi:hypothetical protein